MEPHFPTLFDAIARARPTAAAIRTPEGTTTWRQLAERTDAFGAALLEAGIAGATVAGAGTAASAAGSADPSKPWDCPNPLVALYLHNHPAYLEAMVGAWKARATAMNVNYRYRATELVDLLNDAGPEAIVYHQAFTPALKEALPRLTRQPRLLLRVPDDSGHAPLPGARDYEDALAAAGPLPDDVRAAWSHEDRYVVFTGGTTGTPKGVLWRQSDFAVSALGFDPGSISGGAAGDVAAWAASLPEAPPVTLPAPPFMHGAAHWNALAAWLKGGTVVLPEHPEHFDPDAVLDAVEWGEATALIIVGDAFARPLLDADRRRHRQLPSLRHLLTGGAILSPSTKSELARRWPHLSIVDVLGSSESGRQAVHYHRARQPNAGTETGTEPEARAFRPGEGTVIVNDAVDSLIEPPPEGRPSSEVGWLARSGRVPLGYLGHPERTASTFPVLAGHRLAVTGDRARYLRSGDRVNIELLGRESACINTGGEKVFAEEVEERLAHHPSVADLVVAPAEDARFGQAVGAVAALRPGAALSLGELREFGREHLADYKLPRRLVIVDEVVRSPSGKPDYPWARAQLAPEGVGNSSTDSATDSATDSSRNNAV